MAAVETSQESNEDYEYVCTVNFAESKKPPMCRVQIDGNIVEMMIDSGASVNLLDETISQRINKSDNKTLIPARNKIYSYGSATSLPLLGTFTASIKSSSINAITQLHTVKGKTGNLLSYNAAQKLDLIRVSINTTTVVTDSNKNRPESLKEEFKSLFGGVGKVPNKVRKVTCRT